jgi:hypothetical protein
MGNLLFNPIFVNHEILFFQIADGRASLFVQYLGVKYDQVSPQFESLISRRLSKSSDGIQANQDADQK